MRGRKISKLGEEEEECGGQDSGSEWEVDDDDEEEDSGEASEGEEDSDDPAFGGTRKRKRGGGGVGGGVGGGGGGKKAARGKKKPATAATAATPSPTSEFRGVTWKPGPRWQAQLVHNGKHTYLGYFDTEEGAARAHDRMALWCHLHGLKRHSRGSLRGCIGGGAHSVCFTENLNIEYTEYVSELEELGRITQDELVLQLRKERTHGPTSSKFLGVTWVSRDRRWEAKFYMNRKQTSLGIFDTEEGAAHAYDRMMVWFILHKVERKRGNSLNFDYAEYKDDLEELGHMTQIEVVAKLKLHAQTRREAARNGEGDEACDCAGAGIGGLKLRQERVRAPTSSKFRGVSWKSQGRRWEAKFNLNHKQMSLGCFDTEEDAARAFDRMLVWCELNGAKRRPADCTLNVPRAGYQGEEEELKGITMEVLVEKLRQQGREQRAASNNAEGDEASEGEGGGSVGAELGGAGEAEVGEEGAAGGGGGGGGGDVTGAEARHQASPAAMHNTEDDEAGEGAGRGCASAVESEGGGGEEGDGASALKPDAPPLAGVEASGVTQSDEEEEEEEVEAVAVAASAAAAAAAAAVEAEEDAFAAAHAEQLEKEGVAAAAAAAVAATACVAVQRKEGAPGVVGPVGQPLLKKIKTEKADAGPIVTNAAWSDEVEELSSA
jgi:hypothetical protein